MLRFTNLSRNVTKEILTEICSCYGEVRDMEFVTYKNSAKPNGVAYVRFV